MQRKRLLPLTLLLVTIATACASSADQAPAVTSDTSATTGFYNGFIHGFVIFFALLSLTFSKGSHTLLSEPVGDVQWYYGGFLTGIIVFGSIFPAVFILRRR